MNFPLFIAFRYLFSKKKQHIINLISAISGIGVVVCTAALVIVLSIFNGFENLISNNVQLISPDLKILPAKGKNFIPNDELIHFLQQNPSIEYFGKVIEENALFKADLRQKPVIVKGVENNFEKITGVDTLLFSGNFRLETDERAFAVVGYGIARDLGISPYSLLPFQLYTAKRKSKPGTGPAQSLNRENIYVSGIVSGDADFMEKYVIVPFEFARKLFDFENEVSAIELKLTEGASVSKIKKDLEAVWGDNYSVKTRLQLNESLYKMLKSERFSVFTILIFVLILATFNILASLSMLIIDKQPDIHILKSMGTPSSTIRKIFWLEGSLIVFLGSILGIILGIAFCFAQQKYGLIQLQSNNYITSYYPVDVRFQDILLIFVVIQIIGLISAIIPVRYITHKYVKSN